jgi:signal transduction histidine kinase/CheY-like chemotaxis protein
VNIKVHTGLVLAVCTLTGVVLGTSLVFSYRQIESMINQVGPTSAAMKDVERLKESVGQWLMSNDLVLHGSETFMVSAANRQAEALHGLIAEIGRAELAQGKGQELASIAAQIAAIQVLVKEADDLRGDDRAERMRELGSKADHRSEPLVTWVDDFARSMRLRAANRAQHLDQSRHSLGILSWMAACLYLGVVWLCWLWTVHMMVTPITELRRATARAQDGDGVFSLRERGPDEVKHLTRDVSTFVERLQTSKLRTEQEVCERTAELVRANQAKAQFLATMSHELRTPLNGMINMNELILETRLDEEQRSFARTAKGAAEALLALINDILDFSKIEARKLQLENIEFDVRELVDGAAEILGGISESKGLDLQAIVGQEVPDVLVGDPTRLRQIVVNLLNNALKFTTAGSICVRVASAAPVAGSIYLRVEVRDTGIGIPPDRVGALFKVFEQVDSSTTRRFGGTGLGLAICKELATLMDGEIGVDSEVGIGSTFWFTARLGVAAGADSRQVLEPVEVVVLSAREHARARLVAQLCHLGVPERSIWAVAAVADLAGLPPPERRRRAVVDAQGLPEQSWRILEQVERAGVALADCAALEHWLRGFPPDMGMPPAPVARIPDPVRLPKLAAWLGAAATIAAPQETIAAAAAPRSTSRILVVEDNPVNQKVVRTVLERSGYPCVLVEHGGLAVDEFERGNFDLVLMDCQMPVMDGFEASRRIRQIEAERGRRRVTIVALTANAVDEERQRCVDAGMDEFMTKPFRHKELLALVGKLLAAATSEALGTSGSAPEPHA